MNYKIYIFVQDQCPVSKQIKKEFGLEDSTKSTLQGITIEKQYPRFKNIKSFNLTSVPTTVIVSSDSITPFIEIVEYKQQGYIRKQEMISKLEDLKKGKKLFSKIQY